MPHKPTVMKLRGSTNVNKLFSLQQTHGASLVYSCGRAHAGPLLFGKFCQFVVPFCSPLLAKASPLAASRGIACCVASSLGHGECFIAPSLWISGLYFWLERLARDTHLQALGLSQQGAQKGYGPPSPPPPLRRSMGQAECIRNFFLRGWSGSIVQGATQSNLFFPSHSVFPQPQWVQIFTG